MSKSVSVFLKVMMAGVLASAAGSLFAADQFVKPTKEELEMKSLPGYPGAAAVVLFREQITRDELHVVSHYDRIKVLTDEGKKYANVELNYVSTTDSGYFDEGGDDKTVGEIVGRTIHADGTVIPFTGKPYSKVIEKGEGFKYQAKVFTLPDVEVGSLIEYRYNTRISDHYFESPSWIIQSELYVKSAHFQWWPTTKELTDQEDRPVNAISWFPILPAGAKIERHEMPNTDVNGVHPSSYDLVVKDVAPQPREEYMPPIASFSYRVLFAFTPFRSGAEFWKDTGKHFAKNIDSFANPNGELKAATDAVTAGATTQSDKLKKIYAAVMTVENTAYTRGHEKREDKAAGLGKVSNAADIWSRKRGTPIQITDLFIGMARAAGMKAYAMEVPDRSEELFAPGWLDTRQFDAVIATVNVDGKDQFFDPGERYCAYGQLAWEHTLVQGLREVDGGTDFAMTPGEAYQANKTSRVANLAMDAHGEVTGKVDLTYVGAPALQWRHTALRGDAESLRHAMQTALERELPKGLDVKVSDIKNLEEYEQPLIVNFKVTGTIGSATGKRLVVPADIFTTDTVAAFPHEKRELAVYFHYPQTILDAQRINFPAGWTVEAAPTASKLTLPSLGACNMTVTPDATGVTTRRSFVFGTILVKPEEYPALRTFYSQFEAKDLESVVLKPAVAAAAVPGN